MSYYVNDEEMVASYKKGEEEAFKELINKYTSSLYNFVARLTDKNHAPDIVQETFIKIWKNLHKFDSSKANFKTWIFIIAKNTTIDFLRKKKSLLFSDIEKEDDDISFSQNIPDEELIPDEALQKLQDSELLNKLINQLTINHKTILILHYQEDMTFEEMGKILNKPLNTVKSDHRRAILKLRKMLT